MRDVIKTSQILMPRFFFWSWYSVACQSWLKSVAIGKDLFTNMKNEQWMEEKMKQFLEKWVYSPIVSIDHIVFTSRPYLPCLTIIRAIRLVRSNSLVSLPSSGIMAMLLLNGVLERIFLNVSSWLWVSLICQLAEQHLSGIRVITLSLRHACYLDLE